EKFVTSAVAAASSKIGGWRMWPSGPLHLVLRMCHERFPSCRWFRCRVGRDPGRIPRWAQSRHRPDARRAARKAPALGLAARRRLDAAKQPPVAVIQDAQWRDALEL